MHQEEACLQTTSAGKIITMWLQALALEPLAPVHLVWPEAAHSMQEHLGTGCAELHEPEQHLTFFTVLASFPAAVLTTTLTRCLRQGQLPMNYLLLDPYKVATMDTEAQ
jgi:hypothetical protein